MNFFNKIINFFKINSKNKLLDDFYLKLQLINENEKKFINLSDNELKNKTSEYKNRFKKGEKIENLLIDSFSTIREVSRRLFNNRHYDVQILGGIALHYGNIIEMFTGEGKTLTATLPSYLNVIINNKVYISTINDYLSKRDLEYNKPLFDYLDITVGINISTTTKIEKKKSYKCNIIYGTNNEFCFDYLNDKLIYNIRDKLQNKMDFIIIDEIDSVLIDESKTPLTISYTQEFNNNNAHYIYKINKFIYKFDIDNINNNIYYKVDFNSKNIELKNEGFILIENILINLNIIYKSEDLYNYKNIIFIEYIILLLKSYIFFKKNIDYIVDNNKVIIIDETTGRLSLDKRLSDGIHQAIEAKENVNIIYENLDVATITFKNYFNLYNKISGMTGTAITEKKEFKEIYNLNIIKIPTNNNIIRKDFNDIFFLKEKDKINFIIDDTLNHIKNNRPVLIGTCSVEKSELLSKIFKKKNIKHNLLNAKNDYFEHIIISQAGLPGNVTIATNIAGRGTDIILGGNYKLYTKNINDKFILDKIFNEWKIKNELVKKSGGLHIIGTERNESRRIDNQLIGRSGRQGDPGSSRFYLSLEDKIFKNNNIINILFDIIGDNKKKYNIKYIENSIINNLITNIQKNIEKVNFDIRKNIFIYDNILNLQRTIIYNIRDKILFFNKDIFFKKIKKNIIKYIIIKYIKKFRNKTISLNKILFFLKKKYFITIKYNELNNLYINKDYSNIYKLILFNINNIIINIEKNIDKNSIVDIKKYILLKKLDNLWINHINNINFIKKSIHLRIYSNKNPYEEYESELFRLFRKLLIKWQYQSYVSFIKNNYKTK